MAKKFPEEKDNEICRLYKSGFTGDEVAEKIGCSQSSVMRVLKRNEVKRRSLSSYARKYELNHSAFKEVDDETAYWAGFLMADGNVDGDKIVQIWLDEKDSNHLQKFLDFLDSDHKIHKYKNNHPGSFSSNSVMAKISFYSKDIVDCLGVFGITANKSKTAKANLLQFDRHFWRGVIDGDGSIYFSERKNGQYTYLSLGASKPLVEQFENFCKKIVSTKANSRKDKTYYSFKLGGTKAEAVIAELYGNDCVALDRKNKLAKTVIDEGVRTLV